MGDPQREHKRESSALLEVRDLSWIPPRSEEALWEGVSFSIYSGERVIIRGESGSGKSTLLRCLVHLEAPASGAVYWRGDKVESGDIRRFRHRVLYVHQSPEAIATTVREEMAFAREMSEGLADEMSTPLDEEGQRSLLARFGLGDLGWERRVDELSVGERQRVALVRCFSVGPQVLLLDEPTASLDDTNARRIEDYVSDYVEDSPGRAAVWITHSTEQRQRLQGRPIDIDDFRS